MSPFFLSFVLLVFTSFSPVAGATTPFNPQEFKVHSVSCPAVDRVLDQPSNITIEYVDINPSANTTIMMVHGWPSLWSSWGRQIEYFKNDYHIIAIDVRGFGGSSHPLDVQSSSSMADITGDLTCILGHAGVSSAICMGHDWGSVTCYEAARRRPDVFSAVIGVTVPYLPAAGLFQSAESLAAAMPSISYQVFFSKNTSEAVVELNQDIRRTLRGTLRSVASPPPKDFLHSRETFMGAWDGIEIPPIPYFSKEEEDYFVERFSKQGFNHSLMFYTRGNRFRTWQSAHDQGNFTISQPVLSVLPLKDPVASWELLTRLSKVETYLPRLTTKTMGGAHWPHMEFPDIFNAIVADWLTKLDAVTDDTREEDKTGQRRVVDEL